MQKKVVRSPAAGAVGRREPVQHFTMMRKIGEAQRVQPACPWHGEFNSPGLLDVYGSMVDWCQEKIAFYRKPNTRDVEGPSPAIGDNDSIVCSGGYTDTPFPVNPNHTNHRHPHESPTPTFPWTSDALRLNAQIRITDTESESQTPIRITDTHFAVGK